MQAQQHLSHLLYTSWKASPTPNSIRPQLRAPQATTKMLAHSSPEAPEPQVSTVCTLALRGTSLHVQENKTQRQTVVPYGGETMRTCSYPHHYLREHWPCGPTPGPQQQELSHESSSHAFAGTQGDQNRVRLTSPVSLPSCPASFHANQTRLLTGPGSFYSFYTSLLPHILFSLQSPSLRFS